MNIKVERTMYVKNGYEFFEEVAEKYNFLHSYLPRAEVDMTYSYAENVAVKVGEAIIRVYLDFDSDLVLEVDDGPEESYAEMLAGRGVLEAVESSYVVDMLVKAVTEIY